MLGLQLDSEAPSPTLGAPSLRGGSDIVNFVTVWQVLASTNDFRANSFVHTPFLCAPFVLSHGLGYMPLPPLAWGTRPFPRAHTPFPQGPHPLALGLS